MYFLKQKKLLVIAIVPSCMFYALWELPEFLQRTLSIGLISGDVDKIFTGRIDSIWLPLIKERFSNLNQLLFGVGRFSMMDSPLYLRGHRLRCYTLCRPYFLSYSFSKNSLVLCKKDRFSIIMDAIYLSNSLSCGHNIRKKNLSF